MNKLIVIIFILILGSVQVQAQSWHELQVQPEPLFNFTVNDTLEFAVLLVKNPLDSNLYYATQLETNVCHDDICLPIQVNLFWDLLGNFHHFSKEKNIRFTKFDHQYFDQNDYKRLQTILTDSLSPLRDYQVEDLLDKQANKFSLEIDAVTRPTSPLFSNVTVPGALYTVYTLWHIVNGPIKQQLNVYLNKHYQQHNWAPSFAGSRNATYQEYFLKHLTPQEATTYRAQIVALLFASDDYVPHYALEELPTEFFESPDKYNQVLQQIDALKAHV
ncbi:MAG: hypothetical protein ACRDE7_13630, partial [Sphingobacterium sp.]